MTPSDGEAHWEGEPLHVWERLWGIPELHAFESLPSTNDWLRARGGPLPAFTTVLAETQLSGRGRNGQPWASPPGGLWMSWSYTARTPGAMSLLPLRTGVAAAGAIRAVTDVQVGVKWPNDLWIDGRKVGGILCEATRSGVVIGVGINLRTTPDPELCRTPPVALEQAAGGAVSRSRLAGAILSRARDGFDRGGAVLRPDELADLAEMDVLSGLEIRVEPGPEGRASGIDEVGRLRVTTPDGVQRISSGTIEVRNQQSR